MRRRSIAVRIGITNIQAVVQLVGTPDFSLGQNIDITLPIQVRLHNAPLGAHCVIGSAADPITLHLTTTPPAGTNNASLITNSFLVAAADVGSVSGYQPGR